ncbi:MAG: winged helix-turn-helix domain-containing protein [Chloroflexi bacterium]|nr:MAG: winged helix-turn-helix domain-containing protein [Chloroflexota bacterium]
MGPVPVRWSRWRRGSNLVGWCSTRNDGSCCGARPLVEFTKREWEVLSFFLASPNQYFRAEEILAQTWGTDSSEEQLRTYITRMRQKLAPFQTWCKLITEKGRGYCLVLEAAPDKQ